MINLLPDDNKRQIRAARMNVILLRYNFFVLITIAALCIICVFFYLFLHNNQSSAQSKSSENSAKAATYAKTRAAADEYRSNLSVASNILANEVNYTNTIFTITKLLPSGVVLDGLSINSTDFGKQLSFSAHAQSVERATKLKQNFEESKAFSNVYLQNVTDDATSGSKTAYPVAVTISAKLNETAKQ